MTEPFGHQRKALPSPAVFFINFIHSLNQVSRGESDQNPAKTSSPESEIGLG